ncbi:hypothetical protein HOY80DRAFT_330289 [Tuber brumale]|nr:hypothetical protein HOY80DRAFT_330289 [Tuber brumale]
MGRATWRCPLLKLIAAVQHNGTTHTFSPTFTLSLFRINSGASRPTKARKNIERLSFLCWYDDDSKTEGIALDASFTFVSSGSSPFSTLYAPSYSFSASACIPKLGIFLLLSYVLEYLCSFFLAIHTVCSLQPLSEHRKIQPAIYEYHTFLPNTPLTPHPSPPLSSSRSQSFTSPTPGAHASLRVRRNPLV